MRLIAGPVAQPIVRPVVGGWRTLSRRFADILKGRTAIAYDPQDLATMYQDAAGTLPVYRPGSGQVDPPVGLLLDKSGGGHHASQNTAPARPTLSGRYNLLLATETLSTQSVTTVATDYTLRFEGAGSITLSGSATGALSAGAHTITCTAGTLTLTVAGTVTKADLRVKRDGSSLPAYQRVDSATTYDTNGFPLYLKRDMVDDLLTLTAPAVTGPCFYGTPTGVMCGDLIINAGAYNFLSPATNDSGPSRCTQWVVLQDTITTGDRDVVKRYVLNKSCVLSNSFTGNENGGLRNIARQFNFKTLNIEEWDASQTYDLFAALYGNRNLTSLDTSSFYFSRITNATSAFHDLRTLAQIDISNFDVSNCLGFIQMFQNGYLIEELDVSKWSIRTTGPSVTFYATFENCAKITTMDISGWNTVNVISTPPEYTGFRNTWAGCSNLSNFIVGSAFNNTPCTNFANAFANTNLNQASIDAILVSINTAGTSNGTFNQSGGSAPSATGQAAITAMRSRGWTVTVTGGF